MLVRAVNSEGFLRAYKEGVVVRVGIGDIAHFVHVIRIVLNSEQIEIYFFLFIKLRLYGNGCSGNSQKIPICFKKVSRKD